MKNGPYILVIAPQDYPGKKYRNRYCYEHHLVWWEATGCLVPNGFLLHHKNHNKHDNIIDNLELISIKKHNQLHHTKTVPNTNCYLCGTPLIVSPYKLKSNRPIFCSRQHSGKYYSDLYWKKRSSVA